MFRRNSLRRRSRGSSARSNRRLHPEALEDRRLLAVFVDGTDAMPDGGGCGSLSNPCNTIQTGVDEAFVGEDVYVLGGLYGETVTITHDLQLTGLGSVTIDGDVNGIDITGGTTDVRIQDIDVTASAIGIRAAGIGSLELKDVTASSNATDGVAVLGADSVIITDGVYNLNGLNGITLDSITGDVLISGSDITTGTPHGISASGNGERGLDVRVADSVTIFAADFETNGIDGAQVTDVGAGGIIVESVRSKFNTRNGVEIGDSVGTISIDASDLSVNSGSGLWINNMGDGDITLRNLRAVSNGDKGASIADVASISDTDGDYTDNGIGGMELRDVVGAVTLYNTTVTDNAGIGVDLAPDLSGVGASSLAVLGGTYVSTMPGGQTAGISTLEVGEVHVGRSFGPTGGDITVSGHAAAGVLFDGGMRVEIEGGTFTGNGSGIDVLGYGETEIEDATATLNAADGVFVAFGGPATVTGGTYDGNGASGLGFDALPRVTVNQGSGLSANFNIDGLFAVGFGELFVNGGAFMGNDIGLHATLGSIAMFSQGISATGNGTGAFINDLSDGFFDRDGDYSSNDDHGLEVQDIAGVVVLTRTTANDNDADFDGTGDGLTAAADVNPVAIGFDLIIEGGSFSDTDGPGFGAQQQNGIAVDDVGNAVFVVPANDPGSEVSATGNREDGVSILTVGTAGPAPGATFVGGTFSDNAGDGLDLGSVAGILDVQNVAADRNGGDGLKAMGAAPAFINSSSFDDNTGDGLALAGVGTLGLQNANANRNGGHGLHADAPTLLAVEMGDFNDNTGSGLFVSGGVTGDLTISDTNADDNAGDGLSVSGGVGGTLAIFDSSFSAVFDMQTRGVDVDTVAGPITVSGSTASSNTEEGLRIGSGMSTADATFSSSTFNTNGADGINVSDAADVAFDSVTASGNGDDGLHLVSPASFSDALGTYNANDTHGTHLVDVGGDVKFVQTTADLNDDDLNGVGDGIHVGTLGTARRVGGAAIAGDLAVVLVGLNDNYHGLWVESVTGATILLDVTAGLNEFDGINVENGGAPISVIAAETLTGSPLPGLSADYSAIVRGGSFIDNGDEGIRLRSMDGDVRMDANPQAFLGLPAPRPLTASENGTDGIELDFFDNAEIYDVVSTNNVVDGMNIGGGFDVDINGGTFDENGDNGISVFQAGDVSVANTVMDLVGVPALFPLNAGIYILDNTSVVLENNTITNTDRVGVDIELTPTVTFVTTTGNVTDDVNVDAATISHTRAVGTVDEMMLDDVEYSGVTSLTVDSVDSDDTISVQLGAGLPAVSVVGGEQGFSDILTAVRDTPTDTITVTPTSITDGTSTVTYAEIEKVVVDEGDFNFTAGLNVADIDALVEDISAGNNTPQYELTGDNRVDHDDLVRWLELGGAANLSSGNSYLFGDANLDGFVNGRDFLAWNANKFISGALWSGGDFNADGETDALDFAIWEGNKFMDANAGGPAPTPEPSAPKGVGSDEYSADPTHDAVPLAVTRPQAAHDQRDNERRDTTARESAIDLVFAGI